MTYKYLGNLWYVCVSVLIACGTSAYDPYKLDGVTPADSAQWGTPLRNVWIVKKLTDPGTPSIPAASQVKTIPYMDDKRIIFGYDSVIHCVNKNSGETLWSFACDPYWNGQTKPFWDATDFIVENGRFYALMGQSKIVCLDLESGQKLWLYDTKTDHVGRGFSQYSHSPEAFYVTLYNQHYLIAVSKTTGTELWRSKVTFPANYKLNGSFPGPPTYMNGKVFFGFRGFPGTNGNIRDGGMYRYDAMSGDFETMVLFPSLDTADHYPYLHPTLYRYNATDWQVIPYNNSLLFSTDNSLISTDEDGNFRWRTVATNTGSAAGFMGFVKVLYNGNVYGHTNGNTYAFAYSIDAENGSVVWTAPTLEEPIRGSGNTGVVMRGAMTDAHSIYKVSDVSWLIGQDLSTGAISWSSSLRAHLNSSVSRVVTGGFAVEDNRRVYFIAVDSLYCMERTDK